MSTPPDFTSGAILTAAQMNSVGLWLVKTQTVGSAVASVTVTDAFSSDFENYKIVISGGAGSTAGATLNMTLGATATGYYFGATASAFASATVTAINGNNTTSWSRAGVANTNSMNGEIGLFSPNLAKRTHYNGQYVQTVTGGNAVSSGGFLDNATQYTAFTLTPSAGTITGGIIRVYGYRN
jgi:uncharacterized protein YdbL (DUF1318 family)